MAPVGSISSSKKDLRPHCMVEYDLWALQEFEVLPFSVD